MVRKRTAFRGQSRWLPWSIPFVGITWLKKGFLWLWLIMGRVWGLYLTFFSSYPIHLSFSFLLVEARRELRTEEKKKIPWDSNFILGGGLRLFCGVECFPEPVEKVGLPQTRHLNNIRELPFANYKLRVRHMFLCSPGTFDRGCY